MYGNNICSGGKKNNFKTKLNWRNNYVRTSQRKLYNHNRRKVQKIGTTSTTNEQPDVCINTKRAGHEKKEKNRIL